MTTVNLFDIVIPMVIVWVFADDLFRSLKSRVSKPALVVEQSERV